MDTITKISSFAKLYGYIRYFHPSNENTGIDWDMFCVYACRKVYESGEDYNLKTLLNELFLPIAPTILIAGKDEEIDYSPPLPSPGSRKTYWQHLNVASNIPYEDIPYNSKRVSSPEEKLFDKEPVDGEFLKKDIGNDLVCYFPLVLYSDSENDSAENDFGLHSEKLSGDDVYVRIAGIVIIWNIYKHFYPYSDLFDIDWDGILTDGINNAIKDKTGLDFVNTLKKLGAPLGDSHIYILNKEHPEAYTAPLNWEIIQDKLVITKIYDDSSGLLVGDIVLEINGKPVEEAVKDIMELIPDVPPCKKNYFIAVELRFGDKDSNLSLKIENNNGKSEIETTRNILRRDLSKYSEKMFNKELKPGIHYIDLRKVLSNELSDLMKKLSEEKAIIFDLRGYPKDNIHEFLGYLSDSTMKSQQWQVPRIIYPDQTDVEFVTNDEEVFPVEPQQPRFSGKAIFLISGRAQSYAETIMAFAEHYKLGEILGEPTAGTNGNYNHYRLPGGFEFTWTGMKVLKNDGSRHHGIGILPTIPVNTTIKAIREGRDECIEKALEIIQNPQNYPLFL